MSSVYINGEDYVASVVYETTGLEHGGWGKDESN
jgi:hypothetical protein